RHDGIARMYRLCKFCGFSQTVGSAPKTLRPTVHGCTAWRSFAGSPYIWWVGSNEANYVCAFCQRTVDVATHLIQRPVDDQSHPWWQVGQAFTFDQALAFWTAEGRPGLHL